MRILYKTPDFICFILLLLVFTGCSEKEMITQAELGSRSAEILTVDGFKFKDLNKNGELDPYEDWRLSADERVADLKSQMTLEEKVGFMLISSINMGGGSMGLPGASNAEITSDLTEKDVIMEMNFFTRKPLPEAALFISETTKGIRERQLRHFILRTNASAKLTAEWSNKLQLVAEDTRLGIPAIVASNPRNHITIDNAMGVGLGETVFSTWPGELGLAAMRDLELTREFAEIAAKEWISVGLRKGYQYMADLSTEPRWVRTEGTFGENADLAANMIREITLGFQGEKLGPQSVALTTKHFPGGGPQVDGQDPHFDWGTDQHYPGNMFDYHLKPFIAAIEAGTSAMMPYYAKPMGTEFEEVAFAYNKAVITDLLRTKLGFRGIINSDTGPIYMMPWGVEGLSIHERYKKAVEAGVDLFSGIADPAKLLETIKKGMISEERIDESISRLLKEKFELGIFENPYVDPQQADSIVGNPSFQAKADLALRKSIVLLKNDNAILPLKAKTRVYFETYYDNGKTENPHHIVIPSESNWEVEFVNSVEEADVAILWVIPKTAGLFGSQGDQINLTLSKNKIDPVYVTKITSAIPTALIINYTSQWVIEEIDNNNLHTVLATFGTTTDAVLDVITGNFNPTGKMPFSTPVSQLAAENNQSDVPGGMEPDGYSLFNFNDGISY